MKDQRKTRSLLINPKFQLPFVGFLTLAMVCTIIACTVVSYLSFKKFEMMGYSAGLAADHPFFEFIRQQLQTTILFYVVAGLAFTLIAAYFGFKISHKVAGPLYRMRSHLAQDAERGKLTPVKFREKDFFVEIQDEYNSLGHVINGQNGAKTPPLNS